MAEPLILFWHRRDLRLRDNRGLAAARHVSPQVVGVFCWDPGILGGNDIAPARMAYLWGCVAELEQRYRAVGSQLLILRQSPVQAIPQLAIALGSQAVYWNREVEPYGRDRDGAVTQALQSQGIAVQTYWDQILLDPAAIASGSGTPYTVYTPFWKNCQQQPKPAPYAPLTEAVGLSTAQQHQATAAGAIALPSLAELGFSWSQPLILPPGEQAAYQQLDQFGDRGLLHYAEQRNSPAQGGTSGLSAAFKFGTIGIRSAWATTEQALHQARSDETRHQIQTWQQELMWREFYYHALYHFPQLAEGPYRSQWQRFPWENDRDRFQAWCDGRTGVPIVDAAMRQLQATGWMHNRCRMIVASFLTKDLIIDWRWGEAYFMQTLVDGDLASNNGGWQWSASSGMDSKPLRIFNPYTQAQKFDPEGEYIRQWVPELRSVDLGTMLTGKLLPLERGDYPAAIVDHHVQQQRFKALYQTIR
ncbi:FAD-binding domain-containing protein [Prochlorothrix hollandica]|uniref:Deoxyribodipyrimidine photolyase n=1 Tax=Prochlorothrix hollandica PCC 9006 = CALU 1027 TaxID=317619 RepID=A0A0M2PVM8_PROHO|nr:FAD-binding domain-containing protein [Prochlorothrix hollandica]KKJ00220.1 deoxyribodipyrimidine photolyase [Prochlorothrix hollandica PCC 9006 = CALU 1027]